MHLYSYQARNPRANAEQDMDQKEEKKSSRKNYKAIIKTLNIRADLDTEDLAKSIAKPC